jgi:recombination protein RecA
MENIDKVADSINKDLGKDIAFSGKDFDREIESISTGIKSLDDAIGIGGLPKGRIVEVHGLQSTGKSSLCFGIISSFQKQGLSCAYIDAEYAFSVDHAKTIGIDMDKLLMIQPDCGEEAFSIMEKLIRDKSVQLIVLDSISALVPRADVESEMGKNQMGGQARLVAAGLRKLIGPLSKSGCIIILINQLRANILGGQYDPYIITGGMALRFYSSVMIELKRGKAIVTGDEVRGITIPIKIKKNKVGLPARECEVELTFADGFAEGNDVFNLAVDKGIIVKTGNTYFYGETKLGLGSKAKKYLAENPETLEQIKAKL